MGTPTTTASTWRRWTPRTLLVLVLALVTTLAAAWSWPILTFLPHHGSITHTADDGTDTFRTTMGFPLTCFDCEEHFKHETLPNGANIVSARHEGCFQVLRRESPSKISVINLAYRPLWPGIVINPLFWAAFWSLALWAFARIPPFVRARRGLCPACAYPRGTLPPHAPCPECGEARPTPS